MCTLFLKRREFQHGVALLALARDLADNSNPDFTSIRGHGDAIKASGAERSAVLQPHAPHRYHCAILAHAHDRIVTAIGDEEVGVFIQSRVACPGDAIPVSLNWRKIDWQFQ